jgi:hypothetical protein
MTAQRKVFDLVGRELRSKGKRYAELWRRHCRARSRSAAQAAFNQAVTYGFVPAEILEELETLGHSVENDIGVIEGSCRAGMDGVSGRRSRLYMCADALAYVIRPVRIQASGGMLAARA